eukprot:3684789-Prymnesium_polylepis.1
MESIKLLAPSGVLLAGTHVGGVISFGLGAISFTHVLKARPSPSGPRSSRPSSSVRGAAERRD